VLSYFYRKTDRAIARLSFDFNGIQNIRQMTVVEFDIDNRSQYLNNASFAHGFTS
jgi:hypothetical protein